MTGLLERHRARGRGAVLVGDHRDKRAVRAVVGGAAVWFVDDGQHTDAVLAGAFCHELLDPHAEWRDREQRELVASGVGLRRHERAERVARVARRVEPTLGGHRRCAAEQRVHVDAEPGGGHEAEQRQRGVAAANVRRVDPDVPVSRLGRARDERRAGIGDADEVRSGVGGADAAFDPLPEVTLECGHFDGAATFRRDEEQGRRRIVRRGRFQDRLLIRRIDHRQPAGHVAEGHRLAEDIRAEA